MDCERIIPEEIFKFVFAEAMEDATRRTGAATVKKDVLGEAKIAESVEKYANDIVSCNVTDAKERFNICVKEIATSVPQNAKDVFTFGNIQKLINMTMKYLYIRYFSSNHVAGFKNCYVPMDSVMRDCVYKELNGEVKFVKDCAWSKLTENNQKKKYNIENYWYFQEAIDEILKGDKCFKNRLDYEYSKYNDRIYGR